MSRSFVSVGVTILDIVAYPANAIPENEGTSRVDTIQICVAGTAAAPAVVAAKQGIETALVGCVGSDDMGQFLLTKLQSEGVDTSVMQQSQEMPTSSAVLPINDKGERPSWHMLGAFLMLKENEAMRARIVNADHVHWGGVGLLLHLDAEIGASILAEARQNGAITTADLIAPQPHTLESIKAIAPHLDYFMPSLEEALELSDTDTPEAAAKFFMALGANGCIIKCGGAGSYIATSDGIAEQIPVIKDVKVVDTSGCGDSFCGGFNVGLARGFDPIKACRFATATAAQVASGVGSNFGVKDFETTLRIMDAGTMNVLNEDNR